MNRREQLVAMRPRDLIALADRLGVKVVASKNRVNLKEKKSDVIDRILFVEEGVTPPAEVEADVPAVPVVEEAREVREMVEALQYLPNIYPEIEVRKFDALGAYDLFRDGVFIASVAPWEDGVGIASITTDFVAYDDVVNEIDALLKS